MITNTVVNEPQRIGGGSRFAPRTGIHQETAPPSLDRLTNVPWFKLQRTLGLALLLAILGTGQASTVLGPWTPLFKGIDQMVGTNTPGGGGFARLQVVHALRVDLTDPDIRLFPTPRIDNYVPGYSETAGLQVRDFVARYQVQVAINANFFDPQDYYLPAGTPMQVYGLLVSDGTIVSTQEGPAHSSALIFDGNNQARIIFTNWPAISNVGISNAVSGEYPLVVAGVDIARSYLTSPEGVHQVNPRTAYGLSKDRHTLYLVTLDGRQPGYSDGSLDWETAEWMIKLGAYEAINMDGGGSTTLDMLDSAGEVIEINHSNAVAASSSYN